MDVFQRGRDKAQETVTGQCRRSVKPGRCIANLHDRTGKETVSWLSCSPTQHQYISILGRGSSLTLWGVVANVYEGHVCKAVSSQVGRLPATSRTPKVRSLFYNPEMTVWSWYPSGTSCRHPMGVARRGRRSRRRKIR